MNAYSLRSTPWLLALLLAGAACSERGDDDANEAAELETTPDAPLDAPADALPTLAFQRHTLPAVQDDVPCSGRTNPSATLGKVFVAQTHLMETTWPFFS